MIRFTPNGPPEWERKVRAIKVAGKILKENPKMGARIMELVEEQNKADRRLARLRFWVNIGHAVMIGGFAIAILLWLYRMLYPSL